MSRSCPKIIPRPATGLLINCVSVNTALTFWNTATAPRELSKLINPGAVTNKYSPSFDTNTLSPNLLLLSNPTVLPNII